VLFSDAMQNMHAVGQAQMTNLPVFNIPGSYNLFKPVKVPFMFERPTASFVFGTLSEKDQEIIRAAGLVKEAGRSTVYTGSPQEESMKALFEVGPQDGRMKSIAAVRKDSAGLKRKRNEEETVGESSTGKKARKQAEEDADEL